MLSNKRILRLMVFLINWKLYGELFELCSRELFRFTQGVIIGSYLLRSLTLAHRTYLFNFLFFQFFNSSIFSSASHNCMARSMVGAIS